MNTLYLITCNNKGYVGRTKNVANVLSYHKSMVLSGSKTLLHSALRDHKTAKLTILLRDVPDDMINDYRKLAIELLETIHPLGYNNTNALYRNEDELDILFSEKPAKKRGRPKNKCWDYSNEIYNLYTNHNMSTAAIAKFFNVASWTITRVIRDYEETIKADNEN